MKFFSISILSLLTMYAICNNVQIRPSSNYRKPLLLKIKKQIHQFNNINMKIIKKMSNLHFCVNSMEIGNYPSVFISFNGGIPGFYPVTEKINISDLFLKVEKESMFRYETYRK